MEKKKAELTPKEREERARERAVYSLARKVQRKLDAAQIREVTPRVLEVLFGDVEDEGFDDKYIVEYTETWRDAKFPIPSLVIRAPYVGSEEAKQLIELAETLNMRGSFSTSRESNDFGDCPIEFWLRPASANLKGPSDEALALARAELGEDVNA